MIRPLILFTLNCSLVLFFSCQGQPEDKAMRSAVSLDHYWYQGKAEISHYSLTQNRYKDQHPGEAILIFVTEDFLKDEHVKSDQSNNPNAVKVMKTNQIRRFSTGLYDYSIMTSVFTPVDQASYPGSFKVTMSSQDWCGQSFMQLNQSNGQYKVELRSYFESEGDEDFFIKDQLLEDELFNLIRMNPEWLPNGPVQVIPAASYCRLKHIDMKAYQAQATNKNLEDTIFTGENLVLFELNYPELKRNLRIAYEKASPHKIVGWIEEYPSAFDNQMRKTVAIKKEEFFGPYWKKNNPADTTLRKDLGLFLFD